ncbi:MAG: universal stress protein [Deltaproteobacteria bacterium]|nr:universal stress protein [Deltaproteobacteria bacterium]
MTVRVLVPVDDSVAAHRAVQYIIKMKEQIPMSVTLMIVIPESQLKYHGFQASQLEAIIAQSINHCEKVVEKHRLDLEEAGVLADTRVERGDPAEIICRVAADEVVDFIIISPNGLGNLPNMMFGSVANKVVHECRQPVFLLR